MQKSTPRLTVAISWSTILWMAAPCVHAQPPAPPFAEPPSELKSAVDAVQKACKGDLDKLCPGKNGPDAMACLKSNEDKLTSECKQAVPMSLKPPGR
jgi:hypothetical protein